MNSPQPFRVAVEREHGISYYVLRSTTVALRGGDTKQCYYFVREDATIEHPTGFEVNEAIRLSLSFEGQVQVARVMVRMLHVDPDTAARVTGGLKAKVDRLTDAQTVQLVGEIRARLAQEDT